MGGVGKRGGGGERSSAGAAPLMARAACTYFLLSLDQQVAPHQPGIDIQPKR